ncbi:MAG: hypothetical protein GAK35_02015 [Herbaspirillum frisingense]|uniref:DUF1427 family protein n=1 Tax=Herbaspirillum frisingense TaxID=92645 RepID=A0A7V8FWW5_9BURK|nr:MAG: hypothetical protein GAK35_02015 [Herbaspirillum frisingense]
MKEYALALGGGMFVGVLFGWLKLPLPTPPTLIGITGAFGIYLGSVLLRYFYG